VSKYKFDEQTTAILQNLCNKIPHTATTAHLLDYDLLMNGIKKWPEQTLTSPSGCHLGIYTKMLQKHMAKKKKKNQGNDTEPPTNPGLIKQGHDILFLIFVILTIALKHTYPLQCWQTVWTMFIEKEMGNPNINCLHCIMLFEADWQLLLKLHSSYGFLLVTELAGMLAKEQGRCHKGRSTIDQATQQIVETEIMHLNQCKAINLYLDLRACFNMMV